MLHRFLHSQADFGALVAVTTRPWMEGLLTDAIRSPSPIYSILVFYFNAHGYL